METLSKLRKGLVLVTGPMGSGKSTTLASVIDKINRTQEAHIIRSVAAFEVMTGSTAVRNLIREGKSHQLQSQPLYPDKFHARLVLRNSENTGCG